MMVGDLDSSRGDCRHCHKHKILELRAKRRLIDLISCLHRCSIEMCIFSINGDFLTFILQKRSEYEYSAIGKFDRRITYSDFALRYLA